MHNCRRVGITPGCLAFVSIQQQTLIFLCDCAQTTILLHSKIHSRQVTLLQWVQELYALSKKLREAAIKLKSVHKRTVHCAPRGAKPNDCG